MTIQIIKDLTLLLFGLLASLTLLGLYKPWWVFWWSDFSNRLKVLRVYGLLTLLVFLIYLVF